MSSKVNNTNTLKWSDEEIKLIEAVKKNHSFCSPNYKGTVSDLNRIWWNIGNEINLPARTCRQKWSRIKSKYIQILLKKEKRPAKTKYLDGKLSFLDQYFTQQTDLSSPTSAVYDVVVIESDEEIGDTKDFMVLDLEMIDNHLLKRGPHKDIEMARMEEILSLVSKRIEETMALNLYLNQVKIPEKVIEPKASSPVTETNTTDFPVIEIDIPDVLELDDDPDCDSASQSPQGDDMDVEMSSDNLRNAIIAFPNPSEDKTANTSKIPIASMSIPVPVARKTDDMETVFDIHRRSDTTTFFQELGYYMKRFSKEKQEEIRLKICCVVTEVELEEID